jgi:hypothetical protein
MRVLGIAHMPLEQVNGYPAQLFEKGRIEDHRQDTTHPDWAFMYGRLTDELMTSHPAVAVSGTSVTYGDLAAAARPDLRQSPPAGFTSGTMPMAGGEFVPYDGQLRRAPGYVVPDVFWSYINRSDLFPGGWLHDIGLPMTDAFQAQVSNGGSTRTITMQAFERTVLTDDPQNPAAWRVERANIGTDLALTRHPSQIGPGMPTPTPTTSQPRNLSPQASARASSVLPADRTASYEPWKAIDGNLATAWVEGVRGPGIGETLTLDFPDTVEITHIGIAVGYDRDQETFVANNRVRRAAITFSSGYHIDQSFRDVRGRQEFTINPPEEWLAEADSLTIAITDVYPGAHYDDTPIAEVEVWGRVLDIAAAAE